ncbi:MAG: diacylglycerol kinase family lipid kinase [candidate division Zixibacteria bacterium]|nr:diacylglycerol kinase family lipid kinase [candidate division Zixibacteria bacterium]
MKMKVVINSQSQTKGIQHIEALIRDKFSLFDVDITQTKYPGHAIEITRQASSDGFDIIVAVGGDGTINEIINGSIGCNIPIGIIPYGTANDLSSFLKIPKDINNACDIIINSNVRSIDLIKVNDWFFITSGGIGLPCDVLAHIKSIKHWRIAGRQIFSFLGSKIYALVLLMVLLKGKHIGRKLRLQSKKFHYDLEASSLVIGNQPYLGRDFQVLPGANNNDGVFSVCIIKNEKNRIRFISTLLRTLTGNHINSNNVSFFRTNTILLESNNPLDFFGDGELKLKDTVFRIRLVPGAVKIIAPSVC